MLVVMAFALGGAAVADPRAKLEYFAKHLLVRPGAPDGELSRSLADIGAVEARADARSHVHLFSRAGVGAAEAHARAIHEVMRGIAERLIDVALHVGVKGDHLANGHADLGSSFALVLASEAECQRFRPRVRFDDRPFVHRWPTALERVLNHISGAGEVLPGRADEKISIVPSKLTYGRASNPAELSESR